jgi:hypothetical protein
MPDIVNIGAAPNDGTGDSFRDAFGKINNNSRLKLAANLGLYVATTGNDTTGDGSSGAPWATIQKAIDVVCADYDLNGYTVTINIADGTYAENVLLRSFSGSGQIALLGNTATPANVHIAPASGRAVSDIINTDAIRPRNYDIQGVKLTSAAQGVWIRATNLAILNVDFGVCAHHLISEFGARTFVSGSYSVSGNADVHLWAGGGATVQLQGTITVTFIGSRAWGAYAWYGAQHGRVMNFASITNSGTITGSRWRAETLGLIIGSSAAPGSTSGTTATGGVVT